MSEIEFFFDVSSPFTYMAFHNIQPIIRKTGATITWRPFLVGAVFNAVNKSLYARRADADSPQNRHGLKWIKDWARLAGVAMNFPSPLHPLKSVNAMRFCCALESDQPGLFRFADRAFDAYFRDGANLDKPEILAAIADSCGLDAVMLQQRAESEEAKQRLRDNTQEAIDRGGFGSPTMFVNRTEMFFGNDQLPIVEQAIQEADLISLIRPAS